MTKILCLTLLILTSRLLFSQDGIQYHLPKKVEKIIAAEYGRDFYKEHSKQNYVRLEFECDTLVAHLDYVDKTVSDEKHPHVPLIKSTNRFILLDSSRIPLIFELDINLSRGMVTKSHGTRILFTKDGTFVRKE